MSEDQDRESKTLEPTEKRIRDAIERGDIPVAREATTLATLLAVLIAGHFALGGSARRMLDGMSPFLDDPAAFSLAGAADATQLLQVVAGTVAMTVLPVLCILTVAGLAASMAQNAPRFVGQRIQPKGARISPIKGWQRLFSLKSQVEFGKSLFKIATIAIVLLIQLRSDRDTIISAMLDDPAALPEKILNLSMRLVASVSVATIVLVGFDLFWTRIQWRRNLRMSHQDMKDEHKQTEGDPMVKARIRSLQRDRAHRRMMAAVPTATLVVANPTHFAVALRYLPEEGGAPVVVAKGQDLVALKIRETAELYAIPVFESRDLARSLFAAVQVDQTIPPQFFRAVAELIYIVMNGQARLREST